MLTRHKQLGEGGRTVAADRQARGSHATKGRTRDPYLSFALHWWWLILACAILGAAGAWSFAKTGPVTYQSASIVTVQPQINLSSQAYASQREIVDAMAAATTYANQALSPHVFELASQSLLRRTDLRTGQLDGVSLPVAMVNWVRNLVEPAVELAGLPALPIMGGQVSRRDLSPEGLMSVAAQGNVSIGSPLMSAALNSGMPLGGNTFRVSVTDANPIFAQALANALATAIVQDTNARAASALDDRSQQLQVQINATRQHLVAGQLFRRQQDLVRDLRSQQAQSSQLDMNYQQGLVEQARSDQLVMTSASAPSAAVPVTPAQDLSDASAEDRAKWLSKLEAEQAAAERNIADLSSELAGVRQALAAIPASKDPLLDAANSAMFALQAQQLQAQSLTLQTQLAAEPGNGQLAARADQTKKDLESARQKAAAAQLRSREQDLMRSLADARAQLLQVHSNYDQQLSAQIQMAQLVAQSAAQSATAAERAAQQKQLQDLNAASARALRQWLQVVTQNRADVQRSIADLTNQLAAVREEMEALPPEVEPAAEDALMPVYTTQMQNLSQEYARLQLNTTTAKSPLVFDGAASEGLPTLTLKRVLPMGTAGGLVLGIVLSYLLGRFFGLVRLVVGLPLSVLKRRPPASLAPETVAVGTRPGRFAVSGEMTAALPLPRARRASAAGRPVRGRRGLAQPTSSRSSRALALGSVAAEDMDVEKTIEQLTSQVSQLRNTVIALRSGANGESADDAASTTPLTREPR